MYIDWVIHCFVEEGQNDIRKMAASLFYFYTDIGRSISEMCWLQSLLHYIQQSKNR